MLENTTAKKPVIVIALVMAACLLGNEMLFIVLPLYWEFFGLIAIWQVGVLLSVNRFIRIVTNSLIAKFYEKVSPRTGILLAVVLAISSTFSYGYLKGIWFLLVARCLWGIAWSLFRLGGYMTIISHSTKKSRGEYVGLFNGLWGIGTLVGMLFGGILVEQFGVQVVTTAFAIIGACGIPFVLKLIPKAKNTTAPAQSTKEMQKGIWKNKRVVLSFTTGLIVSFVVYGVFSSTLSHLIGVHIQESLVMLSLTIGAASLAGIFQAVRTGWEPFLSPLIGKLSDQKWGRSNVLIVALFLAALCFFVLPIKTYTYVLIGFIFLFQLTTTLLVTVSDSNAADLAAGPFQLQIISNYTLFSDVGAAFGALIAFVMIDFLGIQWLYWLTGVLLLLLASQWLHMAKEERVLKF